MYDADKEEGDEEFIPNNNDGDDDEEWKPYPVCVHYLALATFTMLNESRVTN